MNRIHYDLRENHNVFCSLVIYPVIPKGIIVLRLIPTAAHTLEDVAETIATFKEIKLELDGGVYAREGHTGERKPGTIGFSTIRGGDIAGEHTVMFIGDSERIEITHRATDRKIFAQGALRAAQWLSAQSSGLFNMQDALDLR